MVDINNLNRIRGILSARLGAEIPKFLNPAGPLVETKAAPYAKFAKKHGDIFIYSGDEKSWFLDPQLTKPANINSTDIPGANPDLGNPNAAVEASAALNAAVEQIQQQNAALTLALLAPIPVTLLPIASINASPEPTIPDKIELPAETKAAIEKSAGMNFEYQKQKEAAEKASLDKAKGLVLNGINLGVDALGSVVGAGQEMTDSNTTKTVDAAYDGIADRASNFGPIGKVVGTAMKVAGVAGDAIQSLGGGTDQLTKMDQWMDSSFFSWNIGMLNGFAGKNTQDFGVDLDILASVGSSYGGTASDLNDAAEKAGKKYGLFSTKARKKADKAITDAKSKLNLMGNISDAATDQRLAVQSMGEQAGIAYSIMTGGGYDLKYTYAAKHGGLLEWNPVIELEWHPLIELNYELPTFKEGGNLEFFEELELIPELQKGGKTRTLELLFEYAKKENPRFILRLSESPKGIDFIDENGELANGSHLLSYSTDNEGNAIVFPQILEMEDGSLHYFGDWKDAYVRAVKNKNILKMSLKEAELFFAEDPEYQTAYKRGWPDFFKSYKKGGSLGNSDIPEIEETAQKNVIPEGALHKNKHHMEHAEGLTKKGIPVIDEDGEQQAEIEHSEIIFTLEVTKKLEEYYEIFYSESASNKEKEQAALESGKLLVYLILENTEDRTGLIESCKKGGTLNFKKSTEDLIEEALEWIPTITIIELVIEEKEEKKSKKKSEKELMKEAIKEVLIELLTK